MNTTIRLAANAVIIYMFVFLFSATLHAQDSQKEANQKAEAEMEAALGTVPMMMKVYPDNLKASAWNWFKAMQGPDGAIPSKYSELISLAVASQIPCSYCVYAHTTMAKMLGASDAEVQYAVARAANTRHWSTVLNGTDVTLEDFKDEWDEILDHMKDQRASGQNHEEMSSH